MRSRRKSLYTFAEFVSLMISHRGPIKTPMLSRVYGEDKEPAKQGEDLKPMSAVPLGRFGEAAEVAKLFAFLLSDDSSYMTGSVHLVDGGSLA